MSYSLCLPAWSIGTDCYKEIYKYTHHYGKKVAVIGGKTAMAKAYDLIKEALAGTDMVLSEPIWYGGNATYENVEMLKAMDTVKDAEIIFAIGGGRAVDTCKVVAAQTGKALFTFPTLGSNCAGCTSIARRVRLRLWAAKARIIRLRVWRISWMPRVCRCGRMSMAY